MLGLSRPRGPARLYDPETYERRIERLHDKCLANGRLYEWEQDGVSLAQLVLRRRRFARLVARSVERGEHTFEPGRVHTVRGKKERRVVAFGLLDTIVHGAIADVLEEMVRSQLSPRVFSYRPGRSWHDAVSGFAAYVRDHRARHADPRDRHLHVLCRDVRSYADAIPVGDRAPVWPILDGALETAGHAGEASRTLRRLLDTAVRPEILSEDGAPMCRTRGIPMGQPIACVLMNLYADELDRSLEGIEGGFYARYSDDILFAHEDPAFVEEADWLIDEALARLDLEVHPDKRDDLYLTGAGRRSLARPSATGTTRVPYLGTMVFADGTVALGRRRTRRFLRDVARRAERTASSVRGSDREHAGRVVSASVNRAIGPEASPFQSADVPFLHRIATARHQLVQLDHWIARIVLGAVTGSRDVRAFREVPYQRLREEWGLTSLVETRNNWGASTP